MPDTDTTWQDEDFLPPEPADDRTMAQLAYLIRRELQNEGTCFPIIEEVRLYIMARFYQVSPGSIAEELAGWGMERAYAGELVKSALATDRYSKKAEKARRPPGRRCRSPNRSGDRGHDATAGLRSRRGRGSDRHWETCPVCDRVLYPSDRLRPPPSLSWPARLLLLAGCFLSAMVYWVGLVLIRRVVWIPMWMLSLLWFPVALLPAIAFGIWAFRFPKWPGLRVADADGTPRPHWAGGTAEVDTLFAR